ncbi:MAG: RNA methyltransferase, partial [Dehalococcoidales bacterium]|nr:RNA methyltransferase [Dehalococcoidales bacterium]
MKPIKWYKTLATTKGRREAGVFLVEGDRAIRQIIESRPDEITEIITKEDLDPVYSAYSQREVTEGQFRRICLTKTPQGPLAVVRIPRDIYSDLLPQSSGGRVLLLEDIQDPGNVGTLIRSAAAFDYSGVVLSEKCADPLSPKCVQSTAGSILSLWIRRTSCYLEMVEKLRNSGYSLIVAALEGTDKPTVLHGKDNLLL